MTVQPPQGAQQLQRKAIQRWRQQPPCSLEAPWGSQTAPYSCSAAVGKSRAHQLSILNTQLSINFGHELVTSVHTPIAWSDKRPTDEEFRTSFGATRLSSQRLLQFVRRRAHCIRRLVLQNSEGYWCGEYRNKGPSNGGTPQHGFGLRVLAFVA